ncbi:exodeoxyribonuclease VII small subunit [Pseudohongiella sp. SYSU M77423]|jgi:exodeoxyribonuclease VII small subunit|uniref:exodeoxyribonuclease VII small subunit n=1 Tax=Pseudohongiella sp. SYSU M77423 TaxID=3042312 RepID=UPI0024810230|nr:exodeoxyribonuclease VII small subunit [Pseudohongiella sp. SYSU M77423]MDH7942444.1 exodeoxyribonuclease VII small subunit [Pseudohongiella sp. SYSU M77423]MEC8859836.1 exodeoxyribonuclease VII small subunit [Pseudomonadota bacterium]
MSDQKPLAFEQTLAELETLVNQMEEGNMGLEDSLAAFEKGIRLTRECQQALQQAELRVQVLTNPDADPVTLEPLATANNDAVETRD